ncbi:MAG: hypothetical protein Q8P20_03270 [bacterium]|nr:hypothetical protein [bacterium]
MPPYLVSAKVAYKKNHLRPLILFLIEKRESVIGDDDFSFLIDEYVEYIKKYYKYPLYFPKSSNVKNNLYLLNKFKLRDNNFKIINSKQPILISKKSKKDDKFYIFNCYTEYLTNTLRFIECSIHLDEDGQPLEKDNSFFGLDQHHKITFMGESTAVRLGKKEEAIFNYLRKHFNEDCGYKEIFEAVEKYKKDDSRVRKLLDKERAGYIRDGIDEIRPKLYLASGYRLAIETVGGRASVFKLVY